MKKNSSLCFFTISSLLLVSMALSQSVWQTKLSGWQLINDEQRKGVFAFNERYKDYLKVAKTELSSTQEVVRLAKAAGFSEYSKPEQIKVGA